VIVLPAVETKGSKHITYFPVASAPGRTVDFNVLFSFSHARNLSFLIYTLL